MRPRVEGAPVRDTPRPVTSSDADGVVGGAEVHADAGPVDGAGDRCAPGVDEA